MRILLDECVAARLARELTGHEVTTVRRMRWDSLNDGEVLHRAALQFDVFLTVDQSLEFQQVLPPGLALITIVSRSIRMADLREFVPEVLAALSTIRPGHKIRISH